MFGASTLHDDFDHDFEFTPLAASTMASRLAANRSLVIWSARAPDSIAFD